MKKTVAHRQMVMIRKEKKEKKNARLSLKETEQDGSPNKCNSHIRLQSLLVQYGVAFIWTVYTVKELKILRVAYGVHVPYTVRRKVDIANLLVPAIRSKHRFVTPTVFNLYQCRRPDSQRNNLIL